LYDDGPHREERIRAIRFVPRRTGCAFTIQGIESTIQFLLLGRGQRYHARLRAKTVPKLFNKVQTLIHGQAIEVNCGQRHDQVSHSRRLGPIVGYPAFHDSRLLLQPHRGALAGVRCATCSASGRTRGLLRPVRVVVPNRNVETYLRMGVARACGIAANLQVTFLRKLLGRVAQQALPNGRVVGCANRSRRTCWHCFTTRDFSRARNSAGARLPSRGRWVARRG